MPAVAVCICAVARRNKTSGLGNLWCTLQKRTDAGTYLATWGVLGSIKCCSVLFMFVLILNVGGLSPYSFTLFRQIRLTLCISTPLWISSVLINWTNKTKSRAALLVPLGVNPYIPLVYVCLLALRPLLNSTRINPNRFKWEFISIVGMPLYMSYYCYGPLYLYLPIPLLLVVPIFYDSMNWFESIFLKPLGYPTTVYSLPDVGVPFSGYVKRFINILASACVNLYLILYSLPFSPYFI